MTKAQFFAFWFLAVAFIALETRTHRGFILCGVAVVISLLFVAIDFWD